MKTLIATSVLIALLASGVSVMAQEQKEDYLGLPGDNLNLYAVMKLFQESKTLEEFEISLNNENSRINNLDLNNDNFIDYISVFDNVYGNVHNIVLQVAVNERERQDVAVFTVDRDNKGNVLIQLTGDEELYGKNYIIEPVFDDSVNGQTPNPGYTGNAKTINGRKVKVVRTTTVEIATWPLITYIYLPDYVVWRSSWYWGYYPPYWSPWSPYSWHFYYGYHYNWYDYYYAYYRPWHHHRHTYWNDYYYQPYRSHSTYVTVNIRDGHYKSTYSRPDDRKRGEALYSGTYRDNSSRPSSERVVDNQNRRTGSVSTPERGSGAGTGASSRRSEGSTTTRTETRTSPERKSTGAVRPQASSSGRKAEGSVSRTRASESRSSGQSRPSEAKTRENSSKSASPERRASKLRESGTRESNSKSKETSTKKENSRR